MCAVFDFGKQEKNHGSRPPSQVSLNYLKRHLLLCVTDTLVSKYQRTGAVFKQRTAYQIKPHFNI